MRRGALLSLAALLLAVFARAEDCPKNYSASRAATGISRQEWEAAEKFCVDHKYSYGDSLRAPMESLAKERSPEFAWAVFLACQHSNAFSNFVNHQVMLGIKNDSPSYAPWLRMNQAKINAARLPAEAQPAIDLARLGLAHAMREAEDGGSRVNLNKFQALLVAAARMKPLLSEEELKPVVRMLAEYLTEGAVAPLGQLPGLFPPKAFQFSKQIVRRELGLPYKPLTDMVVLQRGDEVKVKIVSVDPIEGRPDRSVKHYGFEVNEVAGRYYHGIEPSGEVLGEGTEKWEVGGKRYEASYRMVAGEEIAKIAPQVSKLNYEGMWRDGKITGMIVPASNMGTGEAGAIEVMDNYVEYFKEKGFKFGPRTKVASAPEFIENEIRSGRLDYVIKEAHAGGSDSELVRVLASGEMATGVKKLRGGKEQVVHVFYPNIPDGSQGETAAIGFQEMREWMGARTRDGGSELFYLDTSCLGLRATCPLVNTTSNPNLVVAGSQAYVDTFTNDPGDPVLHLLNGLQKEQSFAEIRADARKAKRKHYIFEFPDTAAWKSTVQSGVKSSLSTEVKLRENGRAVTIETMDGP